MRNRSLAKNLQIILIEGLATRKIRKKWSVAKPEQRSFFSLVNIEMLAGALSAW